MIAGNRIVISLGRKGSGKSQLLWDWFTSKHPRVLTLGLIPQDLARDPGVVTVLGWPQLQAALRAASAFPRWHIAAAIEPVDTVKLFALLAPVLGSGRPSLSSAFGGIAVECSEAYDLAPNGRTPDDILRAWRAGRHYNLDLYMASQSPASIARELTAAADHIFAFAQSEPRHVKFLADTVSLPFAERVRRLSVDEYQCAYYNRIDGTARLLDKSRRTAGRLDESPTAHLAG